MIHLVNNLFLEYQAFFDVKENSLILFQESNFHPISKIVENKIGEESSLQDYLTKHHEGKFSLFWRELLNKENKFVLVGDEYVFQIILIYFWKNYFKNQDIDTLFRIYNEAKRSWTNTSLFWDKKSRNHFGHFNHPFDIKNKEEFELFIKENKDILSDSINNSLGIPTLDLLICDYYYQETKNPSFALKKSLEYLFLTIWFSELNEIKQNILDRWDLLIKYVEESEEISITNKHNSLEILKKLSFLNWIVDKNFKKENFLYIKQNYSVEVFEKTYTFFQQFIHENFDPSYSACNNIDLNLLFNDKFETLLNHFLNDRRHNGQFIQSFIKNNSNLYLDIILKTHSDKTMLSDYQLKDLSND